MNVPSAVSPVASKHGLSAYFLSCNRGKRSLALDLRSERGREVLDDLVRASDVLVENFLPDAVDKLGLTPVRLHTINPRLVIGSISGFGRTGPMANDPGYDLAVQAMTGLMAITGEPDGAPMKVGVALSDVITGLYTAVSVLAGLHAREQGRSGWAFDLALTDCTLASLVNVVQSTLITGQRPRRYGNAHAQIVPYQTFLASDGWFVLAVGNDEQWQRFCKAAGRADLVSDPRFTTNPLRVTNRDVLIAILEPLFRERTASEWLKLAEAAGVPHGPVLALDQVVCPPLEQFAAREMVIEAHDTAGQAFSMIGSPVHWQDRGPPSTVAAPELGQHTAEVLRDWAKYDDARISELKRDGVIE